MACRPLATLLLCTLLAGVGSAAPFADRVVDFEIGTGGGAGRDRMPGVVLGPPHGGGAFHGSTDTFSLGLGGWIILGFDTPIVDGPGPDFTVFENVFLTAGLQTGPPFAEPGKVSVSADGRTWSPFPCHLDAPPYYPGCAGVYPVFADAGDPSAPSPLIPCTIPIEQLVGVAVDGFVPPACSGGDSFDLADVGLASIRFVRIDASQLQPGLGGEAGFDLDAIAAIHSAAEPPTVSTTTVPEVATTTTTAQPDPCPQAGADGVLCLVNTGFPAPVCAAEHLPRRFAHQVERARVLAVRVSHAPPHNQRALASALARRIARIVAFVRGSRQTQHVSPECRATLERVLCEASGKLGRACRG
jgi:hypothetical protein